MKKKRFSVKVHIRYSGPCAGSSDYQTYSISANEAEEAKQKALKLAEKDHPLTYEDRCDELQQSFEVVHCCEKTKVGRISHVEKVER